MINAIKNIDDVKLFFGELLEEGLSFHPDEDFHNYINYETKEDTYPQPDAELRNKLMDECFEVCKSINIDIYDLSHLMTLQFTGLDKIFPSLIMDAKDT